MTQSLKQTAAILLLAVATHANAADSADKAAVQRISNAELSACVGNSIERYDDGVTPVGDVASAIWQACRGDDSQAAADSPNAADMLNLRIRRMVTEHRNAVVAARAAKNSAARAARAGAGQ